MIWQVPSLKELGFRSCVHAHRWELHDASAYCFDCFSVRDGATWSQSHLDRPRFLNTQTLNTCLAVGVTPSRILNVDEWNELMEESREENP